VLCFIIVILVNDLFSLRPTAGGSGAWPIVQHQVHFTRYFIEASCVTSRSLRPSRLQPLVGRLILYFKLILFFTAKIFISSFTILAFDFKSLFSTFSLVIFSFAFFTAFLIISIGILAHALQ
jgi:hypothetical protein